MATPPEPPPPKKLSRTLSECEKKNEAKAQKKVSQTFNKRGV